MVNCSNDAHYFGYFETLDHDVSETGSIFIIGIEEESRSQWPRDLRRWSAAARLLRSWVQIPPGAWIFVCCECCVLPGRGLCDELITRTEESYRLWCVVVCYRNLKNEDAMTRVGSHLHQKKKKENTKDTYVWRNLLPFYSRAETSRLFEMSVNF